MRKTMLRFSAMAIVSALIFGCGSKNSTSFLTPVNKAISPNPNAGTTVVAGPVCSTLAPTVTVVTGACPKSSSAPRGTPTVSPSTQPLAATCNAAPLTNGPVPNGFGVNGWGYNPIDLDGIKAAGFCWMRTDFDWPSVESTRGVYNFSVSDKIVAGLEQRGLHPLFILAYNNPLYAPPGSVIGENSEITTDTERQAFARYSAAAVQHFKGHTIIWELWNEPGIHFTPNSYMALANDAIPAMRKVDPQAHIIAPATAGLDGVDMGFLSGLFSQGLLPMINAVSTHLYQDGIPEDFAQSYPALHSLIAQHNANTPIVSSEWGVPIKNGFSAAQQGEYVARYFLTNTGLGVNLSIWFCWPSSNTHGYGMSPSGGVQTPAYKEMQRLTTALNGLTYQRSLTAASGDYILLYSGSGRSMLAAWTKGNTHSVTLPDGKSITLSNDPMYTAP